MIAGVPVSPACGSVKLTPCGSRRSRALDAQGLRAFMHQHGTAKLALRAELSGLPGCLFLAPNPAIFALRSYA